MSLQIGQILGRYRIEEEIGSGGMGVVYRAFDERLNRNLAIKVLRPGLLNSPASRKRFRNEALMLSKLNHPAIQIIHDFDELDGTDFLVSELLAEFERIILRCLEKDLELRYQSAKDLAADLRRLELFSSSGAIAKPQLQSSTGKIVIGASVALVLLLATGFAFLKLRQDPNAITEPLRYEQLTNSGLYSGALDRPVFFA